MVARFVEKPSPIAGAKAVKNATELNGMREAHLRDSVALAHTWHWIESQVLNTYVTPLTLNSASTSLRRPVCMFHVINAELSNSFLPTEQRFCGQLRVLWKAMPQESGSGFESKPSAV